MGEFVVRGGHRLDGTVRINGAKNAVLPIMAASLLTDGPVILRDVPRIRDVAVMADVLTALGAIVERTGQSLAIDARGVDRFQVPELLMQEMRASIFVMGPLLGRLGRAAIVQPGGCAIGDRPINLHLAGFQALGAEVSEDAGGTLVVSPRLQGAEIHLSYPSVGATENLMMAAVMADGETRIRNAAMEPEVVDLAQFLERMGARIRGAGTPEIRVRGSAHLSGADHTVIPDRIESATFALAVAASGGTVRLENCLVDHLPGLWEYLRVLGCSTRFDDNDAVQVECPSEYAPRAISVYTGPYPGFATDMQAQFMAFLLKVPGVHYISERVFENRLGHAAELRRLGARITADQRVAMVYGGGLLHPGTVRAQDLRAGAGLIIAALGIPGVTHITNSAVIERGYENLAERLATLGADVTCREA